MRNKELLYLITMTIFAGLFLLSFKLYVDEKSRRSSLEREVKAYEDFISGDYESFLKRIDGTKISKKMGYYLEKFAQMELSKGMIELENSNYGSALEHFRKVLAMDVPESFKLRAKLLIGKTYNAMGKYEKAYEILRVFLEDARDFHGRGEGLVELAKSCVKLGKFDDIEEIKKELRSDSSNLKRVMKLEDEME